MVGVPRSKGCRTCIQRRVKCDETRPSCTNCTRIKQVCPGYVQTVKFQDEGPRLRQKHEKTRDPESRGDNKDRPRSVSRTSSSDQSTEPRFEWDTSGVDSGTGPTSVVFGLVEGKADLYDSLVVNDFRFDDLLKDPIDVLGYRTASTIGSVDAPFYSPSTCQCQILQSFAASLASPASRFRHPVGSNPPAVAQQASNLSGPDHLLDTAVRALTLAHFGRLQNHRAFVDGSRPYYGTALRLLHTAVLNKEEGLSNRTLCATVLLSFYEMLSSCDDATWLRHATGVGAMMRQRGAQRHRYGFDREIFLSFRHVLLIEAFNQGGPSFLNDPEWRALSLQISHDIREAELIPPDMMEKHEVTEAIYAHMIKLTQICADARHCEYNAKQLDMDPITYRFSVFEKMRSARIELKNLHTAFITALRNLDHLPTMYNTDDRLFPTHFEYQNVYVAIFYSAHRTVLTILNAYIMRLGSTLAAHGLIDQNELRLYKKENKELAIESCQSIDYMLRSSFLGPFYAVFALRTASQVFRQETPEWEWVIAKLWRIGDRHMLMARHMPWSESQGTAPQGFGHARELMRRQPPSYLGRIH